VRLDVGHVAPARAVLAAAEPELRARLRDALAKTDRAGVGRAAAALPAPWRALAEALPRLWGPAAQVLADARALPWPDEVARAIEHVAAVVGGVDVSLDLGEVRGFDYYTGFRLAGYARGAGEAVLRGGRYDELVGRYGRPAPAIGFAVDIEAIAQAYRAADVGIPAPTAVLVCGARGPALALAAALRAAGVRAAADHVGGDRAAYARAAGFARVIEIQDEREIPAIVDELRRST
jgi:ATP phosphoribosyltransferase regulatory subunit